MEVQLTDFENAAFTVFIVLASRVILYFDLNLYLPLSKVDENMRRAQTRDALRQKKFWFSQSLMPVCGDCPGVANHPSDSSRGKRGKSNRKMARDSVSDLFGAGELAQSEYSVLEILQGKGSYRGLVVRIAQAAVPDSAPRARHSTAQPLGRSASFALRVSLVRRSLRRAVIWSALLVSQAVLR